MGSLKNDTNAISELRNTSMENVGEGFFSMLDTALDLLPYIGQLNQTRKINRATIHIEQYSKELQKIQQLMGITRLSSEYYKEKIGPIFIEDFINEHENAKIVYLLNGYQNVFIEELQHESLVYLYFDILRGLRYGDIRRLFFHADLDDIYPPTGELDDIQRMAFTQGLDLKLENLGLINVPITMGNDGTKSRNPETKQLLTEVGDNFIKFINKTN